MSTKPVKSIVPNWLGNGKSNPPDDEVVCVELARVRLSGEGPHRTVVILHTANDSFVFRGDGQTKQEANHKATANAAAFIASHMLVV